MTSEDTHVNGDEETAASGEIILNHSLNTEMKNSYINYAMPYAKEVTNLDI